MKQPNNSMNKTILVLVVASLILAVLGILMYAKGKRGTGQNIEHNIDESKSIVSDTNLIKGMYTYYGTLASVDGSSASGEVGYSLLNSNFVMSAKFNNLAEPKDGYFYEGWLVDSTTNKFISTGKASSAAGVWLNSFSSETDYTSYTKYVLTVEPDDGDPAPATHILEGELSEMNQSESTNTDAKNGYISLADYQNQKSAYGSGKVVLFFNASWCPTCKVLNESLVSQASSFPKDLTVINVDYDKETELKLKYQVKVQHTLVQINSGGDQIAKWVGGGDLQSITDQLE